MSTVSQLRHNSDTPHYLIHSIRCLTCASLQQRYALVLGGHRAGSEASALRADKHVQARLCGADVLGNHNFILLLRICLSRNAFPFSQSQSSQDLQRATAVRDPTCLPHLTGGGKRHGRRDHNPRWIRDVVDCAHPVHFPSYALYYQYQRKLCILIIYQLYLLHLVLLL